MTCPLKVNIKSEIWVIYGIVLHTHGHWIEGRTLPGVSQSGWASGQTPALSRAAPVCSYRVCPLEPSFGKWCTAFKRSHLHREKFHDNSAHWKHTCVCPGCILLGPIPTTSGKPAIPHPLRGSSTWSSCPQGRTARPLILNWEVQCLSFL